MARKVEIEFPFTVFSVEADTDYLLARLAVALGSSFHARAGYFSHQACEKYLKALSVQENRWYLETHKLKDLAEVLVSVFEFLGRAETKDDLEKFDMFDQVGRYGAAANFDPMSKGAVVDGIKFHPSDKVSIKGARVWTAKCLHDLDRFVFNTRGRLRFEEVKYDDGLRSVLLNNVSSRLVSGWTGPFPIRELLVRNNSYFK